MEKKIIRKHDEKNKKNEQFYDILNVHGIKYTKMWLLFSFNSIVK